MYNNLSIGTGMLGLFMSFPLMLMARRRPANLWLALFVFSLSLLSLAFTIYADHIVLFGLFDWPLAGIGAFYYCYVRSLVGLGNTRRQAWHFVPLAVFVVALAWARLTFSTHTVLQWVFSDPQSKFGIILLGFQLLAAAYAAAVLVRLRQYRKRLRENYSSTKDRNLVWLSWLSIAFLVLLIIWIPANLLGGAWEYALLVGRLLALYLVGWFGMRQAAVFLPVDEAASPGQVLSLPAQVSSERAEPGTRTAVMVIAMELAVSPQHPANKATNGDGPDTMLPGTGTGTGTGADKYARSGMTLATEQLIGERLIRRMTYKRDFLDAEIKLTDLAERIGTSPQLLSQYLNHVLGLNFFDYVNRFRVAEVQQLMRDEANADCTLLELAFAAGFNSKSTFNASFKHLCGMSPSGWRNTHARTSEPIG